MNMTLKFILHVLNSFYKSKKRELTAPIYYIRTVFYVRFDATRMWFTVILRQSVVDHTVIILRIFEDQINEKLC